MFHPSISFPWEVYLKVPFLRTENNYDRNAASDASGVDCQKAKDGMCKQEFAEECDINTIVRRFGITGEVPQGVRMPTYQDFTSNFDFHTAANAIALARESFDAMPADVRARFQNDPGRFVDFCSDRKNLDEARRLGLVPAAEIVPDVASGAPQGAATPVREGAQAPAVKDGKA